MEKTNKEPEYLSTPSARRRRPERGSAEAVGKHHAYNFQHRKLTVGE